MMTQQIGFSVLTAPLAAIDRRSLSQAWYSALHLAKEKPAAPQLARARSAPGIAPNATESRVSAASAPRTSSSSHAPRVHQNEKLRNEGLPQERRAMRSALARKIESTFLYPSQAVQRATFTIDGTNARVHVALQQKNGRLALIAVCPPPLRETVARALEEARYALAERGIALDVLAEERA